MGLRVAHLQGKSPQLRATILVSAGSERSDSPSSGHGWGHAFGERRTRRTSGDVRHDRGAPRISAFYGIVIEMHFGDHAPPHFHARYSGEEATIVIATGDILDGSLPPRALRLVREWLSEP